MLVRKTSSKKKFPSGLSNVMPLDSSLTSIEWLPNMQIGENSSAASGKSAAPVQQQHVQQALPVTAQSQHKLEAVEVEIPTSTVNEGTHIKPPYSYVTLIRQAILSAKMHRMTLNEIYQWIVESYPYFRTAPPKWKNSIRHNLSLNKCFKRLQRSTNDPGKGSYWAVDESPDNINTNNQINARKRKYDEIQSSPHLYPSSPATLLQHPPGFCTNNNPMVCGDLSSIGGQSSSTDESESAVSLNANQPLIQWEDLNLDLTASFRRFREQVLDVPSTTWTSNIDPSASTTNLNYWNHDLFPHGETNSFLESVKLASSGEINWNDIDVKPYCEFLDGFRTSSTFPQQDRDKLINITSSLTSFFDYTGITNLAQSKIANELNMSNRLPPVSNRTSTGSIDNSTTLPIEIDEEVAFDWDLIA